MESHFLLPTPVVAASPSFNWTFGDGAASSGAFAHGNLAPTGTYRVTVNGLVNSANAGEVENPDGTSYEVTKATATFNVSSTNNQSFDQWELTNQDDNYYVADADADGVPDYKDAEEPIVEKDKNVKSFKTEEIASFERKKNKGRFAADAKVTSDGLAKSNIEIPEKRILEKEKFQTTIQDSVGYFEAFNYKPEPINTESYFPLIENEYQNTKKDPLSTFGIDVDNASYSIMRSKINAGLIVPKDAVRVEEFVNYFDYNYAQPTGEQPFSVNLEMANCPWNTKHQLVRVALKGKDIDYQNFGGSNLVFLIDVSGSMDAENKLPLVKKSMKLLVDQLGANDRIAIVTYAGAAGLALESTSCDKKELIKNKIDKLDAGGSTAGGEGIKLAYKVAIENLISGGNNRVIMCTDGDFNVGASSDADMKQLIVDNRNKGVFITTCGFGMGNFQDSKLETIADNGNGNYFYIDNFKESEKVFETNLRATLFTIAKDVKIQVEFNPKHVKAYRLIGYENRKMPPQDFNDDTKDGGELGAGHTVTALYEIIPANSDEEIPGEIELKYQTPDNNDVFQYGDEMLTVKLRYKKPNSDVSQLIEVPMTYAEQTFENASTDFRFATGTALFAQQLRQSKFVNQPDFELAKQIIINAKGLDEKGYRQELIGLLDKAAMVYFSTAKE
ncbi:MAG: von Willebrand factor type A domain-containing protein [Bacteroidia bacterium]